MKDYGHIYSNERPLDVQIIGKSVFIASNIQPYEKIMDKRHMSGYEYDYKAYGIEEYIQLMANENKDLREQVLTAQEAICDLYEMILEE